MARGSGLLAFVTGAIVGAAATILVVPDLDEETRRKLREEALHMREHVAAASARARAEAAILAERGRALVAEQRARVTDAASAARVASDEKQRELRAKFEQALDQGEA